MTNSLVQKGSTVITKVEFRTYLKIVLGDVPKNVQDKKRRAQKFSRYPTICCTYKLENISDRPAFSIS